MDTGGTGKTGALKGHNSRYNGQPPEHFRHPRPLRAVAIRGQDDRHCQEVTQVHAVLRPRGLQMRNHFHRQKEEERGSSNH